MYKKVIDILSGNDVNFRDIAISIAKSNPSIFIKAYEDSITPEVHHDLVPKQTAREYFIERNGASFSRHLGINPSHYLKLVDMYGFEEWLPSLFGFLFPLGNQLEKIKAIKIVRQETGIGLRGAKDFCEAIVDGDIPEIKNYNY